MHFNLKNALIFIAIYICYLLPLKAYDNNTLLVYKITHLGFNSKLDSIIYPPVYEIDSIVLTSKKIYWQSSKDLSMTLSDVSANNLSQSISKIAGINTINTGIGIGKPVIRGQFGNRVAVQQNGIKQEGQQWGSDHGLEIDAMDVQDISVLKGAMTLEHGGDASGGIILLDDNIKFNKYAPLFSGQFSSIYKSNNAHAGISMLLKSNLKTWNLEARITYQDYGDYKVPADCFYYNGYNLPIYDNKLKNTAGKEFNTRLSASYALENIKGQFMASAYTVKSGLFTGAIGIPRAYNLATDGDNRNIDYPRQEVAHYKVAYIHEHSNIISNFDLEANLSYQLNYRQEKSAAHAHSMPLDYNGDNNLALALNLQTMALNMKVSNPMHKMGLSANIQKNIINGFEFLIPEYKQAQIEAFYLYKIINKQANFIQHLGARVSLMNLHTQAFDLQLDNNIIQNRANALDKFFFNYALAWSAKYYIKNSAFQEHILQFNLSKLYRNPTINELAANGIHHGTFRHEKGNNNLKPEQGAQANITYTIPELKGFYIQFSAFANYYSNYIYLHATGRFSTLPEGGQLYQYQQDKILLAGGELEWNYKYTLGNEKHKFNISQAYEYVYNQNLNTNTALPFTPPFHLRTSLDWTFKKHKQSYQITAIHQYYAAQNRVDRNEKTTPAYNVVHLQAMYKIEQNKQQSLQFSLQINNIFNVSYYNHLSRYRLLNLPEQGRNIVLALGLNF